LLDQVVQIPAQTAVLFFGAFSRGGRQFLSGSKGNEFGFFCAHTLKII
jgi:hypothetical protein